MCLLISLAHFLYLADDAFVFKQIVAYVPDMVVHRSPDSPIPQAVETYGVLLFADISGKVVCVNCVFPLY